MNKKMQSYKITVKMGSPREHKFTLQTVTNEFKMTGIKNI